MQAVQTVQEAVKVALSATALRAFYFGEQAQKDAATLGKVEAGRLNHLFAMFGAADLTAAKDAFSGMVASIKADFTRDSAEYRSAANRASEAKALFGAHKLLGFKPDGIGYHDSVKAAREGLKAAGLTWEGKTIPTEGERKAEQESRKSRKLAVKAVEIAEATDGKATAENLPGAMVKAKEALALEAAFRVVEKYGKEMAEGIAAQMGHALANFDAWKDEQAGKKAQ